MKKSSFATASTWCLLLLAQLFCSLHLAAQPAHDPAKTGYGRSHVAEILKSASTTPPAGGKIENADAADGAPNISVQFDQEQGGGLLYETVAPWVGGQPNKAQLSLMLWILNKEATNLSLQKVVFEYVYHGELVSRTFDVAQPAIGSYDWQSWQNGRDYNVLGDVLHLNPPLPSAITIKLYFYNYSTPVTFTKLLIPYDKTFGMPFRAFDLAPNEVWESGSTHGGGYQVYGYDMEVQGLENGLWTSFLPNTSGLENAHFRVWGKPIYAMADGVVKGFNNNVPTNPKPGEQANWAPYTNGGSGNHFYIQHGENIALYAHMQKGTLNPALLQVGKVIKAGEFLGLAGNSGNSEAPHLHLHIRKGYAIESGPFRPLLFHTGYTIVKTSFTSLNSNANWAKLTAHGLPGYGIGRAFIWPSSAKPFYSTVVYNGVFRAGSGGYAMWAGASTALIKEKDDLYKNSGLRMSGPERGPNWWLYRIFSRVAGRLGRVKTSTGPDDVERIQQ